MTPPGPLDERDVERAIADQDAPPPPEPALAAPLEGARDDQGELEAEEADAGEALRLAVEGGGPGPEERVLHLVDPVTEALDDEVDLDEESLDDDQRDEVEWRLSDPSDDGP